MRSAQCCQKQLRYTLPSATDYIAGCVCVWRREVKRNKEIFSSFSLIGNCAPQKGDESYGTP